MNFWQNERVRLRGVEPEDAPTFWAWNQDSEMARHLDFLWPPTSQASVRTWAEKQTQKQLEEDRFHWVIENPAGDAVGSISTHHCEPRSGTFMYGANIAREHWGQGYATAAIQLVLRYYFHELRYQKVTVSVHSNNQRSIALHEKLGFVREGTFRRMLFTGGTYVDVHWYGLLREEWEERGGYQTVATAES
ncbi:MAG: GNAT family N-acetyltransferase [Caldilineaceae bacterium]|nr:GNAT family N-acetyltransferase [Caldilineaceae bacterium]